MLKQLSLSTQKELNIKLLSPADLCRFDQRVKVNKLAELPEKAADDARIVFILFPP